MSWTFFLLSIGHNWDRLSVKGGLQFPSKCQLLQNLFEQDTKPLIALSVSVLPSRPSTLRSLVTFIHMHMSYCIVCALGIYAGQMLTVFIVW